MSFTPVVTSKTFIDQQSEELDLDAILDEAFDELEGFEPPSQTENANVEPPPSIIRPQPTPNLEDVDPQIQRMINDVLDAHATGVQNKPRLKDLLVRVSQGDDNAEQDLQKEFPEFMSKIEELAEELINPEKQKQRMDAIRQNPELSQQFITSIYFQFCQMHNIQEKELTSEQIDILKGFFGSMFLYPDKDLDDSKLEKLPQRIKEILIASQQQNAMFQQIQDENLSHDDLEWKIKVQEALEKQDYSLLGDLLKDFPLFFKMEQEIQSLVLESIQQLEFYRSNKDEVKSSLIRALEIEKRLPGWNAQEFEASIDRNLSTFNIQKAATHSYDDYYIALQIAAKKIFLTHRELLEPAVAFCVRLAAATSLPSSPLHYLLTLDEERRSPLLLQLKNILHSELEQ